MKKNIISCMAIMVAALASACGDYQVNHECEIGDVKSENDSVIYRCVGIKDKYSYWEKEICQYGILKDKDGKKMCKECDPDNKESNKCEEINGRAQYRVCRDGVLDVIYCSNNKCSTDYVECKCSETCLNGCEDNGACRLVGTCENHDSMTGGCICQNGNNIDGSCACPQKCKYGCDENGSCKLVEGCDLHDQTGDCICVNGNNEDGTCKNVCVDTKLFNAKDGTCTCDCAAGCLENGLCKLIGNCLNDANCNEYGYCSGNLCYCKEGKCLLNDINGNHIHDKYEPNLEDKPCSSDQNCNVAGGEFCDSAMGYKCSVKCSENTCVDGFICRSDGRCASKYFTTIWDEKIRNGKDTFLFHVSDCKSEIEVCWDWKDDEACKWDKITDCPKDWMHKYEANGDGDVIIKIEGELDGVNFYNDSETKGNCAVGCKLLEVRSFGQVGFDSWYDEDNKVNRGVFEQCYMLKKLSDVDIPDSKKLTSMSRMFLDACSFNSPIEQWDVSNVTDMLKSFSMPNCVPDAIDGQGQNCFNTYPLFNQPLNRWNVSKVNNMDNTFHSAVSFNQPLSKWDVSNVTNMNGMFAFAASFNYPLNDWNVEKVKNMNSMFYSAYSFNQDLSGWDVSKVTNMQSMFEKATLFNQDLSGWDVSKVTTMQGMFAEATSFNQDLSDWNLSSISRVSTSFGPAIDAMSSIFYHSRLENEFTEQVLTLLGNMDCARVILTNPNLKNSNYCKIYKSKNWSAFKGTIFVTCSDVCL